MSEKILKRREVRQLLNVTEYGYQRLIEEGILGAPLRFTPNSHPFHTQSQVQEAERRLFEKAHAVSRPKRIKPLRMKLSQEIRDAYRR